MIVSPKFTFVVDWACKVFSIIHSFLPTSALCCIRAPYIPLPPLSFRPCGQGTLHLRDSKEWWPPSACLLRVNSMRLQRTGILSLLCLLSRYLSCFYHLLPPFLLHLPLLLFLLSFLFLTLLRPFLLTSSSIPLPFVLLSSIFIVLPHPLYFLPDYWAPCLP